MPQFVVPQFIDVEDKIIGPITTRQFIMGVVAMLLLFLEYRFADIGLFIIEAVITILIYVMIAFIKINGQPAYMFGAHMLQTLLRPSTRFWAKVPPLQAKNVKEQSAEKQEPVAPQPTRKLVGKQSLSSLTLLMDTGGQYRPESIQAQTAQQTDNAQQTQNTST